MAEVITYYQCKLTRPLPGSSHVTSEMVAWIARGTKVGNRVQLMPSGEFWTVAEVYEHGLPSDVIKDMEANYRAGMPSTRDTDKDKRKKAMS